MSEELSQTEQLKKFCQEIMKITNCSEADLSEFIHSLTRKEQVISRKDSQNRSCSEK
ncbi:MULTISPECIES: hypothetical protein [Prochlorococcus]|uniref:hypothetical protein n=1 Tax=Prochlorococcus TaxID=1218 RepID=UPI00030FB88E|nr:MULTISPECIES: hypothetical protein [Prochlorococcus]KGG14019.1 hypothetical protein EV04_0504 [Prochlorococcus marinus str. LG]KGG19151.1 hypothetical protein EV08_1638 [Prochlorococcus marinus str. SS2]KGG23308.1 hypothetical protein EV09_0932 [Prochlorococcus marinus str. SS35]KGG32457.1 hypothetical protein EV10_1572 [Prochlorococcus marinus str. SS51]KGG35659.1 hypothetical protein EV11_1223 [Prochlorococcus sp. SS52]